MAAPDEGAAFFGDEVMISKWRKWCLPKLRGHLRERKKKPQQGDVAAL